MVKGKPTPKRYEKILDHKSKVNFKKSHPNVSNPNPTFKENRIRDDNPPKTNIIEGENIIIVVVS